MGCAKPETLHAIPSATGGIARLACARLRAAGKDVAAVASKAGVGIEVIEDAKIRLDVATQIKLLELAAAELGDDLLGFHLARDFELREIGLVYYVMASSVRLADALRNAERYSKIVNEGVRVRFSLERTAIITLDYVNVDRHSDRHQMEFWLVALMRICRHVTETRLAPSRLKVRHSGFGREEMKSFFGRDVDYKADADAVVFPAPIASLPIVGRDPYLNDLLRKYADEALSNQLSRRASLGAQVEKIAEQLLPHGKADVSEISRQLGMSPRSLSRKLQDEGVTCAEILEELKVVLAKRYLSESELPVSEIAWLLGYSEISSLTHAFKRWTGMTPRQFRLSEADRR